MHQTIFILFAMTTIIKTTILQVTSPAFNAGAMIPSQYTCEGKNINPPLSIKGIPSRARSLAVIVEDPDAVSGPFDHWVAWNIPPGDIKQSNANGQVGKNGKGDTGYTGPCPPSGTHHYHFKVYALDTTLSLNQGADKQALLKAMQGHILATGELTGIYKKGI